MGPPFRHVSPQHAPFILTPSFLKLPTLNQFRDCQLPGPITAPACGGIGGRIGGTTRGGRIGGTTLGGFTGKPPTPGIAGTGTPFAVATTLGTATPLFTMILELGRNGAFAFITGN